jgi:hypothetical protein
MDLKETSIRASLRQKAATYGRQESDRARILIGLLKGSFEVTFKGRKSTSYRKDIVILI